MFFNTHQSGVLTALFAYYMAGTTWNYCYHSAHSVCTIQPCTSLHCYFKWRTLLFQIRKRQLHHHEEHCCFKSGRGSYITMKNIVVSNQEEAVYFPDHCLLLAHPCIKEYKHYHTKQYCLESGRDSLLPRQFHLLLRQFNFLLTVYVLFVLYCMRLKWQPWLPPWINKVYIIIVIVRP